MIEQEFLSISQFAKWIGVHSNTIRRAIKNKHIHAFRIGIGQTSWRIPKSEVMRISKVQLQKAIEQEVEKRMKKEKK